MALLKNLALTALLGLVAPSFVSADAGTCKTVLQLANEQGLSTFSSLFSAEFLASGSPIADYATATDAQDVTILVPNGIDFSKISPTADLNEILGTHVIKGSIMAADITDGLEVGTQSGQSLIFNKDGTNVYVKIAGAPDASSATVVATDIMSCAGPLHIITTALIPSDAMTPSTAPAPGPEDMPMPAPEEMPMPAPEEMPMPAPAPEDMPMPAPALAPEDMPAPAPALTRALPVIGAEAPGMGPAMAPAAVCMSLVDAIAGESPELFQIVSTEGVLPPDVLEALASPAANFTVLIPPPDLLQGLIDQLGAGGIDIETVTEVIAVHVILDKFEAAELVALPAGSMVDTLLGEMLEVEQSATGPTFSIGNSTASVVEADVDACVENSIIHLIDGVLVPEGIVLPAVETTTPLAPGTRGIEGDGNSAFGFATIVPTVFAAVGAAALML